MPHSRDHEEVLTEIKKNMSTFQHEATKAIAEMKAVYEKIIEANNKSYKKNRDVAKTQLSESMVSEKAPTPEGGQKYFAGLENIHKKLEKRADETKTIQAILDTTLGTAPESRIEAAKLAKGMNDRVVKKLKKYSQQVSELTDLQKKSIEKTMKTGYQVPGTDTALLKNGLDKLERTANELYVYIDAVKQQAKQEMQAKGISRTAANQDVSSSASKVSKGPR